MAVINIKYVPLLSLSKWPFSYFLCFLLCDSEMFLVISVFGEVSQVSCGSLAVAVTCRFGLRCEQQPLSVVLGAEGSFFPVRFTYIKLKSHTSHFDQNINLKPMPAPLYCFFIVKMKHVLFVAQAAPNRIAKIQNHWLDNQIVPSRRHWFSQFCYVGPFSGKSASEWLAFSVCTLK